MTGSIARRYARAIFALAREDGVLVEVQAALQQLAQIVADPEMLALIANPLLTLPKRRAVAHIFSAQLQLQPVVRNFVALLADRRRLDQIPAIVDHYLRLVDRAQGRVRTKIASAANLTTDQQAAVVAAFERITARTVLAETEVDPALLAGVVVEIEGKVYDGSLRTQLHRLAAHMAGSRLNL